MINEDNFSYYLRYLVKITDLNPLYYNEIPVDYQNFFSLPALSQALNIIIKVPPPVNYSTVETYIDNTKFENIDSICEGIKNTFQTDMDKFYAAYYYITHNIEYDWYYYENDKSILDPTVKSVFNNNKGICGDYCRLLNRIAKKAEIDPDRIKLEYYVNYAKVNPWVPYNPPISERKSLNTLHATLYVEIQNEKFFCEPTWGAGFVKDHNFTFSYKKSHFLIPFYIGLLNHFPYDFYNKIPTFSWKQFTSLNKVNLEQEVSLESNPFQIIQMKNGFYEMQFSLIENSELPISATFNFLNEDELIEETPLFVCFNCIDQNLPPHHFTYHPESKRKRYKVTVYLSKNGLWKTGIFRGKCLFNVYFRVNGFNGSLPTIPICGDKIDQNGFYPIKPTQGLTQVNNGIARIRFAINRKRAPFLSFEIHSVKSGTFERKEDIDYINLGCSFSTEIEGCEKSGLVEKWVSIEFPSDGRWAVCISSKDDLPDKEAFKFYVTYFFDVKNSGQKNNSYPFFDLPKNRNFSSIESENFSISPSSSSVILKDFNFVFHVFSKDEIVDCIINAIDDTKTKIVPSILSEKDTDKKDVKDREYSVKFPSRGHYKLVLKGVENYEPQQYFVVNFDLKDESDEERDLMKKLKNQINDEIDYTSDIPITVRENVEKMLCVVPNERELNTYKSACCLLI